MAEQNNQQNRGFPISNISYNLLPQQLLMHTNPLIHSTPTNIPIRINFYNPANGLVKHTMQTHQIPQNIITERICINGITYELVGTMDQIQRKKLELQQYTFSNLPNNLLFNMINNQVAYPDRYINPIDKWYNHFTTTINFSEAPHIHKNFILHDLNNRKVIKDLNSGNIYTGSGVFVYGTINGNHHIVAIKNSNDNTFSDMGGQIYDKLMQGYNLDSILQTTALSELYEESLTTLKLDIKSDLLNKVVPHIDVRDNRDHDNVFYRVYIINLGQLDTTNINNIISAYSNNFNELNTLRTSGNNSYGPEYYETNSLRIINLHNISTIQNGNKIIVNDYHNNSVEINRRLHSIISTVVPANILHRLSEYKMYPADFGKFKRFLIKE